jgi:hypothetical protein
MGENIRRSEGKPMKTHDEGGSAANRMRRLLLSIAG